MFPMHRSYGLQGSLKRPTSLSQVKAGTHSALRKGSHTRALHAEAVAFPPLGHSAAPVPPAKFLLFRHALYTYISRFPVNPHYQQQFYLRPFFIVFFNFLHKWPTFRFHSRKRVHLGFQRKIAHNGTHGETRGVSDGGAIYPRSVCAVRKPCAAGYQNGALCRFGGLVGGTPRRTQKAFRDSDALMRVPLPPALRPGSA